MPPEAAFRRESTYSKWVEHTDSALCDAPSLFDVCCICLTALNSVLSDVAVDYWYLPCRDIDEGSIGLPSQTFKKIWLRQWLASGELKMPGTSIGDCELEKLSWASSSLPKPRMQLFKPFESFHSCIVGRLKGLPEAVTQLGEPILCNIIPGPLERPQMEVTG